MVERRVTSATVHVSCQMNKKVNMSPLHRFKKPITESHFDRSVILMGLKGQTKITNDSGLKNILLQS